MSLEKVLRDVISILFCAVFLAILIIPTVFPKVGIGGENENKEKRVLATKPDFELSKESYLNYFNQYTAYYNDNFGFRDSLIRTYNFIKIRYFKESPVDLVIIGKNGWLFYTGDNVIQQYRGEILFSEIELEKIKNNLEERQAWLANQGIPFYMMIAPNKHTIYSEYLPNYIKSDSKNNKLRQLEEYLRKNSSIRIINPEEELKIAKKDYRVYMKNDTHWNTIGGLIGYQKLMEAINSNGKFKFPVLGLNDFEISEEVSGGDLKNMLGVESLYDEKRKKLVPKYTSYIYNSEEDRSYLPNPNLSMIQYNPKVENLKLLMFRDSFTSAMQPYISEHFYKSIYIWDHRFDGELILKEQPDIVVHEAVERYIDVLLQDNINLR